ncbi:MAG TPA: hypothetical protein VGH24_06320, partial [Solirubrobacteraceae bacterium]
MLAIGIALAGLAAGATAFAWSNRPVTRSGARAIPVARYEYIAGVGRLSVYNIASGSLVARFALP